MGASRRPRRCAAKRSEVQRARERDVFLELVELLLELRENDDGAGFALLFDGQLVGHGLFELRDVTLE